jgi:hypothetical protein
MMISMMKPAPLPVRLLCLLLCLLPLSACGANGGALPFGIGGAGGAGTAGGTAGAAGAAARYAANYYTKGTKEQRDTLRTLFGLLAEEKDAGAERFVIVREIAGEYRRMGDYGRLAVFLTGWVADHPDDPFNTYYLFTVAFGYVQQDAPQLAALYFNMIVRGYPDITVRGESVHLACLRRLVGLEDDPARRLWYYEELLTRFPDEAGRAADLFLLGQTAEEAGEWRKAIDAYAEFVRYYGAVVPGFPNAYQYAKQLVDFDKSAKDWTFESLDALLATVKRHLDNGSARQLWQYRARVNFFALSWAQAGSDDPGSSEFNLSSFGSGTRLRYADELAEGSNANEAYLRTWGWTHFTTVWYFYFRKVYFPPDPDIHGRWEWAGVYYGERF